MSYEPVPGALPRIAFELEEQHLEGLAGVVLLRASGEIDFAAGPRLRDRLSAHLDAAQRMLVLDLSAVTFIDSMAIGVLVSAATRMREIGTGSLSAVCSSENERVLRIFDIAGVASLMTLHRTLEDALAGTAPAEGTQVGPAAREGLDLATSPAPPSRLGVTRRYAPGDGLRDGLTPARGAPQVDELA